MKIYVTYTNDNTVEMEAWPGTIQIEDNKICFQNYKTNAICIFGLAAVTKIIDDDGEVYYRSGRMEAEQAALKELDDLGDRIVDIYSYENYSNGWIVQITLITYQHIIMRWTFHFDENGKKTYERCSVMTERQGGDND